MLQDGNLGELEKRRYCGHWTLMTEGDDGMNSFGVLDVGYWMNAVSDGE